MIRKHSAVAGSLVLIQVEDIKYLDHPIPQAADSSVIGKTLRDVVLELTFPLVPTPGQKVSKLFHSIDFATSGRDAGELVNVTAYADREDVARKLISILPAYVIWAHSCPELETLWFHPQLEAVSAVTFHTNAEGTWDGTWTSAADQMHQDLLDEDMGTTFKFDNLCILDQPPVRRIAHSDALSVNTFGLGAPRATPSVASQTGDSDLESQGPASSVASGGSGSTN